MSSAADYQYANWLKQMIMMIAPKNLYLAVGRAAGKTTDILAERAQDVVWDMPGGQFFWAADTYLNAQKNVVPSLVEGWQRLGWVEGVHYVIDERPPAHFKKPFKRVVDWKHTLTTWNGCHFKIISMDRPSTGAGDSYQHGFGDEAKYLEKKRIDKLFPAMRGEYVRFHKSVYYLGKSFTTDMPDLLHSEHDWILETINQMDPEQIKLIVQAGTVLNDLRQEWMEEQEQGNDTAILEKLMQEWEERWVKVRRKSSFFYNASSFINIDILTVDYFLDALDSLGWQEFKKSVLGVKPTLRKGQSFYPRWSAENVFKDGNTEYFDKYSLKEKFDENCRALRYHRSDEPLTAGLDVGASLWMVVGQKQGAMERGLKEFYTVPKDWVPELGKKFRDYFSPHRKKLLRLYYDRSANQYKKVGEDVASKVKHAIEFDENGHSTGWVVKLMNEHQGNISQSDEYEFMIELLEGSNDKLPQVQLDFYNCRNCISSIENAPVKLGSNSKGQKFIQKDKSSEKKLKDRPELLPSMSTNFSDAFKYWLMRKEYIALTRKARLTSFSDPVVRG